jgi:hypothetical protein
MSLTLEDIMKEQCSIDYRKWVDLYLPKKFEQVQGLLSKKRQRLEHCINFVLDDTIHTDGKRIWIISKNEEIYSITEDSDPEIKTMVYSFYTCMKEKETLPKEISELEEIVAYLYSHME